MRRCREGSNTAALSFSRRGLWRSAGFAESRWALRSAAASFSEPNATAPARVECARSPFSVLKRVESEEDAVKRITDARQVVASVKGKSWWTKYPRGQTAVKREQARCLFHEPATGFGQSRAALHLAPAASWEAGLATGCEPSLFLVGQVRPLVLEKLIRKSPTCHYPILELRKM
jgi:hypothetical protein